MCRTKLRGIETLPIEENVIDSKCDKILGQPITTDTLLMGCFLVISKGGKENNIYLLRPLRHNILYCIL